MIDKAWRGAAALAAAGAAWLFVSETAAAQYGQPGMGPGGMQPPGPAGEEQKEEGPAEEAPEEERPSDLEPLGSYPQQARRRTQVIELDGYLRLRTDYMHNFFLGQGYTGPLEGTSRRGRPPFPWPVECRGPSQPDGMLDGCGSKGLGAANLRLRLEPAVNVTDMVRAMAQIDVLDNTLMGSTPDSLAGLNRAADDRTGRAPAPPLYTSQDPPEIGQNGFLSSIRAKRAWAEVDSEFGSLRFGRMPWHFGRGIAFNAGSCPDCDGGTTVDRVMVLSQLYGHQVAGAWDFGAQGVTSGMIKIGRDDPQGYPVDLSQNDDVLQVMAAITKLDDPDRLRERLDHGDLVANYGLQLLYRDQEQEVAPQPSGGAMPPVAGERPLPAPDDLQLQPVGAKVFQGNLWFKLAWKALTLELEGTGIFGKIDHAGPLTADPDTEPDDLTLVQVGWVLASELRLYREAFFLGFETGGATGDAAAEDRAQYLNYRWRFIPQPAGDHELLDFKFSPEYHVDEILFRRILGTVTNALYFKPQLAYWLDLQDTRKLGLSAAFIYSLPLVASATPGDDGRGYGLEMNLGLTYRNSAEGFYAGIIWGVLWPLWSLDRPLRVWADAIETGQDLFQTDAAAAQVLRTFLGVRF